MAPRSAPSEQSFEDTIRRIQSHQSAILANQEASPDSERRKRLDSTDISNVGAGFEDSAQHPYFSNIQVRDLEDYTASPSSIPSEAGPSYFPPFQGSATPGGTSPATPRNDRTTSYTRSSPFLRSSDMIQLRQHLDVRRSNSWRTASSGDDNSSSEYLSARDASPLTRTEYTDDGNSGESGSASQRSAYYTPSHTPSHQSEGTVDDSGREAREPESPHPWSAYNARNGRSA